MIAEGRVLSPRVPGTAASALLPNAAVRRRAAPMLEVWSSCEWVPLPDPDPEDPTRFVEVLVASLAKVVMMSVAKHTHGSCESRYSACVAHSAQATDFVSSGFPAPIGSATTIDTTKKTAARRSIVGELVRSLISGLEITPTRLQRDGS